MTVTLRTTMPVCTLSLHRTPCTSLCAFHGHPACVGYQASRFRLCEYRGALHRRSKSAESSYELILTVCHRSLIHSFILLSRHRVRSRRAEHSSTHSLRAGTHSAVGNSYLAIPFTARRKYSSSESLSGGGFEVGARFYIQCASGSETTAYRAIRGSTSPDNQLRTQLPASRVPNTMIWPLVLAALGAAFAVGAYDYPTTSSALVVVGMAVWVVFLMVDYTRKTATPSLRRMLGLVCHITPALCLYCTCYISQQATNSADTWMTALLAFRYWRTTVQLFFWFVYQPARPTGRDVMKAEDCTVLLPTVGPAGNDVFEHLVASVLVNEPARVVFSTNTAEAKEAVHGFLRGFRPDYENGVTDYQQRHNLPGSNIASDIKVVNVGESSKRRQVVAGLAHVETDIVVSSDDTAEWTPRWLKEALAAFNDPEVGLVGTRKWVKHLPSPPVNPADGLFYNAWLRWYARFWNNMGGLYLIRHNFEMQSTNAADGGVFCVSGRSCLIRASILDRTFQHAFTHEFVLGCGPVQPDDDNFITRWILKAGWKVKAQCQHEATMTTVLGAYPKGFKFFPLQCQRWSRSTFRQNPIALFLDRNIWWEWPLTVWTTYLPWMYNAALFWDLLAVYTLTQTTVFNQAAHPRVMLAGFVYFLQLAKLVKTAAWWWAHPVDFLLYFVIPMYPAFTYRHSLMKVHTAFTCLDMEWSGRKLPPPE
ncbi:uncharacterized protein EKO05_0004266 [Ascochyta rabiei]|uniref:uncharacterized protein n=1 Tax=Didymella rabiei TaxID=5454 RepID=UPI00220EEB2A|nr:uncharacterized protein EKO05_0004266 [Ascochyta rabiei]UPX13767.1 hypothetical protein EKO05_0004266 [Ascochyta rabiei]